MEELLEKMNKYMRDNPATQRQVVTVSRKPPLLLNDTQFRYEGYTGTLENVIIDITEINARARDTPMKPEGSIMVLYDDGGNITESQITEIVEGGFTLGLPHERETAYTNLELVAYTNLELVAVTNPRQLKNSGVYNLSLQRKVVQCTIETSGTVIRKKIGILIFRTQEDLQLLMDRMTTSSSSDPGNIFDVAMITDDKIIHITTMTVQPQAFTLGYPPVPTQPIQFPVRAIQPKNHRDVSKEMQVEWDIRQWDTTTLPQGLTHQMRIEESIVEYSSRKGNKKLGIFIFRNNEDQEKFIIQNESAIQKLREKLREELSDKRSSLLGEGQMWRYQLLSDDQAHTRNVIRQKMNLADVDSEWGEWSESVSLTRVWTLLVGRTFSRVRLKKAEPYFFDLYYQLNNRMLEGTSSEDLRDKLSMIEARSPETSGSADTQGGPDTKAVPSASEPSASVPSASSGAASVPPASVPSASSGTAEGGR